MKYYKHIVINRLFAVPLYATDDPSACGVFPFTWAIIYHGPSGINVEQLRGDRQLFIDAWNPRKWFRRNRRLWMHSRAAVAASYHGPAGSQGRFLRDAAPDVAVAGKRALSKAVNSITVAADSLADRGPIKWR